MKWRNSRERRVKSRRVPVYNQFLLVFRGPFDDQTERPRRQPSFANPKRRNLNRRPVTAIAGVKVWWIVLVEVHRDHYAEKPRYFRHNHFLCLWLLQSCSANYFNYLSKLSHNTLKRCNSHHQLWKETQRAGGGLCPKTLSEVRLCHLMCGRLPAFRQVRY